MQLMNARSVNVGMICFWPAEIAGTAATMAEALPYGASRDGVAAEAGVTSVPVRTTSELNRGPPEISQWKAESWVVHVR
jgi:hypothetical protein